MLIRFADSIEKAARDLKPLAHLYRAGELKRIEYDTETYNKVGGVASDAHTSVLRTVQLNWGDYPVVLDMHEINNDNKVRQLLRAIMADPKVMKIAHNASFEYRFTRIALGVAMQNVWCTMTIEKIIDEGQRAFGYSLADVLFRRYKIELEKETRKSDWSRPKLRKDQVLYAGRDVKHLLRLQADQETDLRKHPNQFQVACYEMAALPVFAEMELAGVKLDIEAAKRFKADYEQEVNKRIRELQNLMPWVPLPDKASKKLREQYPDGVRPVQNNNDFKKALPKMGIKLPEIYDRKQRKTRVSLSSKTFGLVRDPDTKRNIGIRIKDYEKKRSYLTKYFNKMPSWTNPATGRVHYSINQVLVTGRISVSDPPLQQMPKDKWFRQLIIAPKGSSIVKIDYSQLELRIMAQVANDQNMIREYQRGEQADIHQTTAKFIYNTKTPTKEQRSNCKPVNFGCIYDQTPPGLQEYARGYDLEFTTRQCEKFIDGFFRAYPAIKAFHKRIIGEARRAVKRGESFTMETLDGRRRTWTYEMMRPWLREWVNRYGESHWKMKGGEFFNLPIQGTAGDRMKLAMIKARRALKREKTKARIILQVHDELVLEAPENEAHDIALLVTKIMEQTMAEVITVVPVYAEPSIGDTWGTTEAIIVPWR